MKEQQVSIGRCKRNLNWIGSIICFPILGTAIVFSFLVSLVFGYKAK